MGFKDYWIAGLILLFITTGISMLLSTGLASLLNGGLIELDEQGKMLAQVSVTVVHLVLTPYVLGRVAKWVNERFLSGF